MSLSEDKIQEFRTRGVLRVRGALSPEDLQPVIDELEEIIDRRARQLHADGGESRNCGKTSPLRPAMGCSTNRADQWARGWISRTIEEKRPSAFSATTTC